MKKEVTIENIERVIYNNLDDLAVSIARSYERLDQLIGDTEARLITHIAEIQDGLDGKVDQAKEDICEVLHEYNSKEVKCTCSCGNEHMTAK